MWPRRSPEFPVIAPQNAGLERESYPASDTIRGQRRYFPTRSNQSSDDSPAAVKRKGRVGDQKTAHTHSTSTLTGPSFVRTLHMPEEDGTADCLHMIFVAPVGLQSFLLLHRRTRGSSARATQPRDTIRGHRRYFPTYPNLATSRQPPQYCAGATFVFDTVAAVNVPIWHVLTVILDKSLEFVSDRFHSLRQHPNVTSTENISCRLPTMLELLFDSDTCPRPEVAYSIFPKWHHADCETQHCAGATFASDTFHDQR